MVPKQVIRLLNDPDRPAGIVGVMGVGNRNFGATYTLAGRITAQKCNMPLLYPVESCAKVDGVVKSGFRFWIQTVHLAMFAIRDRLTGDLFDRWSDMSPKRRALLERSWAGVFRKHLLDELPVHELAKGLTVRVGRPSKDLHVV